MSSSAADFRLGLTLGLGNRSVEDIWCFLVNYKFQRSENSSSSAVDFMLVSDLVFPCTVNSRFHRTKNMGSSAVDFMLGLVQQILIHKTTHRSMTANFPLYVPYCTMYIHMYVLKSIFYIQTSVQFTCSTQYTV